MMHNTYTTAVILIGDELLSGSIQDLNLQHIATSLEKIGIRVRESRVIPDIEQEIIDTVNTLRQKYDYVFTTGGIGPTHDDITSDSIAKAFGVKNILREDVVIPLKEKLKQQNMPFTEAIARMAHAPEGAQLIYYSELNVIPAYRLENVYVLAGVPSIMQATLAEILPSLKAGAPITKHTIHANVREGIIAAALNDIQQQHPNTSIGSYPQTKHSPHSNFQVIFIVRGTNETELHDVCKKILSACKDLNAEAKLI